MFFYIGSQILGATLASGTVVLIIDINPKAFFGTRPSGSIMQSFVVEIIITFIMMFIVSGATNDHRAVCIICNLFLSNRIVVFETRTD